MSWFLWRPDWARTGIFNEQNLFQSKETFKSREVFEFDEMFKPNGIIRASSNVQAMSSVQRRVHSLITPDIFRKLYNKNMIIEAAARLHCTCIGYPRRSEDRWLLEILSQDLLTPRRRIYLVASHHIVRFMKDQMFNVMFHSLWSYYSQNILHLNNLRISCLHHFGWRL